MKFMELIDTHAHLTYPELEKDIDAVLARSRDAGVIGWVTIGTDKEHIRKALDLLPRYENLWASLGFHPHYANEVSEQDLGLLANALKTPGVVAVGETGLDYHYDNVVPENQKRLFRAHLDVAAQLDKPVVVHTRDAFDDTMAILADYKDKLKGAVIHCYGGNTEQTRLVLDRGYYISFTGTVTFKKSDALREIAKTIPIDRLMIETDCPFISPEPVRRIQPNQPAHLVHTAKLLAGLHNMEIEEFAKKVALTSKQFFSLD